MNDKLRTKITNLPIRIPNVCSEHDIETCPLVCKQMYNGEGYYDYVDKGLPFICVCVIHQRTPSPIEKFAPQCLQFFYVAVSYSLFNESRIQILLTILFHYSLYKEIMVQYFVLGMFIYSYSIWYSCIPKKKKNKRIEYLD